MATFQSHNQAGYDCESGSGDGDMVSNVLVVKHMRFGCTMAGVSRSSTGFDAYRRRAETYNMHARMYSECKQIK